MSASGTSTASPSASGATDATMITTTTSVNIMHKQPRMILSSRKQSHEWCIESHNSNNRCEQPRTRAYLLQCDERRHATVYFPLSTASAARLIVRSPSPTVPFVRAWRWLYQRPPIIITFRKQTNKQTTTTTTTKIKISGIRKWKLFKTIQQKNKENWHKKNKTSIKTYLLSIGDFGIHTIDCFEIFFLNFVGFVKHGVACLLAIVGWRGAINQFFAIAVRLGPIQILN